MQKEESPQGHGDVNEYELCKSEYLDTFWLSNLCSASMTLGFVSSLKMILPVLSGDGQLMKEKRRPCWEYLVVFSLGAAVSF